MSAAYQSHLLESSMVMSPTDRVAGLGSETTVIHTD